MPSFKQDSRLGRLNTVLGPDKLVLLRFGGEEYLNDLFTWRVEALSENPDVDMNSLLGTHATVTLDAEEQRHFDGIVTHMRQLGTGENGNRHDLILRPWFWLASRRRNQRIFHEKTVVQIVQEVLSAYSGLGSPALEMALTNDYPTLEYTVQYRESDLDFVRRQLERHGISFYFRHSPGNHTMVLSDDVTTHHDIGEREILPYDAHHKAEHEHFWTWEPERHLTTGAVRLTDYNFKTPTAAMEVDREGDASHPWGKIESFDYPGDYLDLNRGKQVVGLRVQHERGEDVRYLAEGDCVSLGAGMRVSAKPNAGADQFVVLKARYEFASEAYGTGGGGDNEYAFSGAWTVMPITAPMMPPRVTPTPAVQGPQTAMVVGDGEIDCDKYGRILVRFHWDLNDAYSMRCRVSQNWAGLGWGGMIIPRIGMEVIVEFLEGDPDKPLVTGNVFNGKNNSPYPLPDHKTKAVWRSKTHQGQGFNEISFEDQVGQENIALHAQKDQTLKVLHNRMKRVDHDQIESVGSHKSIEVGGNHQERIGGAMNLNVGGNSGALIAMLASIAGKSVADALTTADEAGDSAIPAFLASLVPMTTAGELNSMPLISGFDQAGQHAAVAGAEQIRTGTALGGALAGVLPLSGVMTTTIEKFQVDTIGLARTEQIGLFKNTMVGMVQNSLIGAKQFTKIGKEQHLKVGEKQFTDIGEEQRLKVGKIKTVEVGEEYTTHSEERSAHSSGKLFEISAEEKFEGNAKIWEIKAADKLLISAPGGYIEISRTGVKIRGMKVEIEGNMIDFTTGGPGEGSKCMRAMAKSATPFVL